MRRYTFKESRIEEKNALMRGILEKPNDDIPRLIYADWLEENGNETEVMHAEFIRLQIRHNELFNRFDENLAVEMNQISKRCIKLSDELSSTLWYRHTYFIRSLNRGFPYKLKLPIGVFLNDPIMRYERVFSLYPIQKVQLTDVRPYITRSSDTNDLYTLFCEEKPTNRPMGSMLPIEIFSRLASYFQDFSTNSHRGRYYRRLDGALKSISNACVKLGREVNQLPI